VKRYGVTTITTVIGKLQKATVIKNKYYLQPKELIISKAKFMIIKKSRLQKIIREELIKTLFEKNEKDVQLFLEGKINEAEFLKRLGRKAVPWLTAAAIAAGSLVGPATVQAAAPAADTPVAAQTQQVSSMKDSFLRAFNIAYPQAAHPEAGAFSVRIANLEQRIKNKIALEYLSEQRKQSFVRFIQNMDRFKDQTPEQILQKYDVLKEDILKIIDSVSVELINEGTHSDRMYRTFYPGARQSGGQVDAAYDEESNKIIINPYAYGSWGWAELEDSIREELYHAIDYNLSRTTIPMSALQKQAAVELDIFLPRSETGFSQERYDYLTSDHEFYAKMLRLKDVVAEQYPQEIDANGEINQNFLLKLMKAQDPNILGNPSLIEILQILDISKLDEVEKYFNMVAQADIQKTSQIA